MPAPSKMYWTKCSVIRPRPAPARARTRPRCDAVDTPELRQDSTKGSLEVDENGERGVPFVGDHLLFLAAIKTDGSAAVGMTAESSAAGDVQTARSQSLLGDFNGDGFDDLVVGAPYEDVVTGGVNNANAGTVTVIYGSATGLTAAGNQVWTQDSAGMLDVVEAGDIFGYALAVGDFKATAATTWPLACATRVLAADCCRRRAGHLRLGSRTDRRRQPDLDAGQRRRAGGGGERRPLWRSAGDR